MIDAAILLGWTAAWVAGLAWADISARREAKRVRLRELERAMG